MLKINLMELEYYITTNFIRLNPLRFKSLKLLSYYMKTSHGKMMISDFIIEIINEIEKKMKEEINDYKEFNEGLSLIIK